MTIPHISLVRRALLWIAWHAPFYKPISVPFFLAVIKHMPHNDYANEQDRQGRIPSERPDNDDRNL